MPGLCYAETIVSILSDTDTVQHGTLKICAGTLVLQRGVQENLL